MDFLKIEGTWQYDKDQYICDYFASWYLEILLNFTSGITRYGMCFLAL